MTFRYEDADRILTVEATGDGHAQVDVTEWIATSVRRVPVTVTVTVPFEELLAELLRMAVTVIGSDEVDAAAAAFGVQEVPG